MTNEEAQELIAEINDYLCDDGSVKAYISDGIEKIINRFANKPPEEGYTMKKIIEYLLVEFEDYELFNNWVQKFLNEGFQPYGQPPRYKKRLAFFGVDKYAQAMVKYG